MSFYSEAKCVASKRYLNKNDQRLFSFSIKRKHNNFAAIYYLAIFFCNWQKIMQMAPTFSRKTERNKKVEGERQVQAFTKQITRSFLPHSLVQCNLKHLQKYYIHSMLPFKRFSSVVVRVWQFPGIWMHSKYDSYISQLQNKWFALNFKIHRNTLLYSDIMKTHVIFFVFLFEQL